jgi:hypothetical protein
MNGALTPVAFHACHRGRDGRRGGWDVVGERPVMTWVEVDRVWGERDTNERNKPLRTGVHHANRSYGDQCETYSSHLHRDAVQQHVRGDQKRRANRGRDGRDGVAVQRRRVVPAVRGDVQKERHEQRGGGAEGQASLEPRPRVFPRADAVRRRRPRVLPQLREELVPSPSNLRVVPYERMSGWSSKASVEVERRRGRGLKARDGRRDAPGKVLKERRSPRRRGRMGTSVQNAPRKTRARRSRL